MKYFSVRLGGRMCVCVCVCTLGTLSLLLTKSLLILRGSNVLLLLIQPRRCRGSCTGTLELLYSYCSQVGRIFPSKATKDAPGGHPRSSGGRDVAGIRVALVASRTGRTARRRHWWSAAGPWPGRSSSTLMRCVCRRVATLAEAVPPGALLAACCGHGGKAWCGREDIVRAESPARAGRAVGRCGAAACGWRPPT